jgi:5-methylcytosine-specific restriction endonuclease McrA
MCTHPYCYEPAEHCQGDHIEPYSRGGATTQENGRLLCGFHNRQRNQQEHKDQRQRPPPTAA